MKNQADWLTQETQLLRGETGNRILISTSALMLVAGPQGCGDAPSILLLFSHRDCYLEQTFICL